MRKTLIALVTALAVSTSGCSWFKHEATVAKDAAIDCAKQDLGKTVVEAGMSIIMTVAAIIFEGGSNWQTDLDKLAAKYGPDAVACAAHIAEQMFREPGDGAGSGSSTPSTAESLATPHSRASQYTSGKRFK